MSEHVIKLRNVLTHVAREHHVDFEAPLPVWDNTSKLMGVRVSYDKMMGDRLCEAVATFTLTPQEYMSTEKIKGKAELAVRALKSDIQCIVRPKIKAKKVANEKALG